MSFSQKTFELNTGAKIPAVVCTVSADYNDELIPKGIWNMASSTGR